MAENFEGKIKQSAIKRIAEEMLIAARTAPKAKGVDRLFLAILSNEEINKLAKEMIRIAKNNGPDFFERDAKNILISDCCIIIGTINKSQDLPLCGYCGFKNCNEKNKYPEIPCAFSVGDLGIAIGSAVSIAMDRRIDNRILFSGGYTAIKIGLTPSDIKIAYVIPLSVSSKNPFFDRK
jgi:uncharacterized ferredoxin-like protein